MSTLPPLADLLPVPDGRVPILAEYPYYRALPEAWGGNLRALRSLGADVVTAYVPWRLHELRPDPDDPDGGFLYDFHGESHPQRDLVGFIRLAAREGLLVMLKPGPYVHGEVRLGGLPDRVTALPARRTADGRALTEERLPIPSGYGDAFAREAAGWLRVVRERVVEPHAAPDGPVAALQIGNEGVYGEINRPMDGEDFSEAALRRHAAWAAEPASPDVLTGSGIATDPSLRERWARWSGVGVRGVLEGYRDALGTSVPIVLNLPLPGAVGPLREPEAWVARSVHALPDGVGATSTSWTGNPSSCDGALASLWLGMRLHRTDTLEDNWGFTWTDASYATPGVPLYNAMLGLAFGSSVVSVYTACTTRHWGPEIAPDEEALRAEGENVALYAPPYCPGAPLDESGALNPNASALRLLDTFSAWAGGALRRSRPGPGARLVVDAEAVVETAWPGGPDAAPASAAVAASVRWMLERGVEVDVADVADVADAAPGGTGPLLVVGGRAMSRAVQRNLAELVRGGRRCVVVGPVPERDESGAPCGLLGEALSAAPGGTRAVPASGDLDTSAGAVLAALRSLDAAEPVVEGGGVLVLRRRDADSGTDVVYLFSRCDTAREVGDVLGAGVTVRLAARGAAVLVAEAGELRSFLVHAGTAEHGEPTLLTPGAGEPELKIGDHGAGRRTPSGWELRGE
ncbi:beta-galactosidase [Actinomadura sp. NEAU-AAG7]|uniref:beta-galactosidase n=1 Tax=Actinomadura sp. NEAU-AAG7 TaxID=2839640 RepID=UPI001BE41925|nr:beta-galactosidase [Actinomadura sp. NEAU-AAG7]MBT2210101.1 beta-galactosidase [Actinomadura sp. NEAU-AAG7]